MRLRSNLLIKTATGLLHLKYIFFPFTFSKQPWHRVYRNTSVVVSIAAVVGLQPGMDAVARQPAMLFVPIFDKTWRAMEWKS
jgi:hypothetical protein